MRGLLLATMIASKASVVGGADAAACLASSFSLPKFSTEAQARTRSKCQQPMAGW